MPAEERRISRVDFFATTPAPGGSGTELIPIGSATNSPYTLVWSPSIPGSNGIFATVTDEFGQVGQSGTNTIRVFVAELILPLITITSAPPNFAHLSDSPVTIAGTASDNIGVDFVEYQLVSGPLLQTIGLLFEQLELTSG